MSSNSISLLARIGCSAMLAFILLGCAHKRSSLFPEQHPVITFKNCKVTKHDDNGNAIQCSCGHFTQGTDAKTGGLIAICEP